MIGFGELRKFSSQWQVDITAVERIYVIGWLLKGIFDNSELAAALVLRGGAALRFGYCPDFPIADDPEFLARGAIEEKQLRDGLASAATLSGLKLTLAAFERGAAKIEYTGPLGRRSAAQPRVTISILGRTGRLEPLRVQLVQPFSDHATATLNVVSLDEMVGVHIAGLAGSPRAREVYDLWYVLTHARDRLEMGRVRELVKELAGERGARGLAADGAFSSTHRTILNRAWDNALREARDHPTLAQAETDISQGLKSIVE